MDHGPIIDRLRHFERLEYRYQLDDALASLWPHTSTTVAALSKSLSDDDSDVRLLAIEILNELGTKAEPALPAMIEALNDEHRLVRIAAVEPVAAFGSEAKDTIPILTTWLEEAMAGDSAVSQHAQCLLDKLKSSPKHDNKVTQGNRTSETCSGAMVAC